MDAQIDRLTVLQTMHGNPIVTVKQITEQLSVSERTARMLVRGVEEEKSRYGDFCVVGEGKLQRTNYLALLDFVKYRKMLSDRNARKHVPPYNPQKIAAELGFYGEETCGGETFEE